MRGIDCIKKENELRYFSSLSSIVSKYAMPCTAWLINFSVKNFNKIKKIFVLKNRLVEKCFTFSSCQYHT